jgi:hypothetical protein
MHKNIEKLCKAQGVSDPLDLTPPTLEHSPLQDTLAKRAASHEQRDIERRNSETIEPYHNGALFGYDATIPADEQTDEWTVSVTPTKEYLDNPRLAGSAWKHVERRHRGDA